MAVQPDPGAVEHGVEDQPHVAVCRLLGNAELAAIPGGAGMRGPRIGGPAVGNVEGCPLAFRWQVLAMPIPLFSDPHRVDGEPPGTIQIDSLRGAGSWSEGNECRQSKEHTGDSEAPFHETTPFPASGVDTNRVSSWNRFNSGIDPRVVQQEYPAWVVLVKQDSRVPVAVHPQAGTNALAQIHPCLASI